MGFSAVQNLHMPQLEGNFPAAKWTARVQKCNAKWRQSGFVVIQFQLLLRSVTGSEGLRQPTFDPFPGLGEELPQAFTAASIGKQDLVHVLGSLHRNGLLGGGIEACQDALYCRHCPLVVCTPRIYLLRLCCMHLLWISLAVSCMHSPAWAGWHWHLRNTELDWGS